MKVSSMRRIRRRVVLPALALGVMLVTGILVDAADVTLVDSSVSGNSTEGDDSPGGGLFVSTTEGLIDVTLIGTFLGSNFTTGARSHGGGAAVVWLAADCRAGARGVFRSMSPCDGAWLSVTAPWATKVGVAGFRSKWGMC